MSDWQPIESPPKDGQLVLVWGTERGRETADVVRWYAVVRAARCSEDYDFKPTHWMPLPTPPHS
jgi:hypothetical protein